MIRVEGKSLRSGGPPAPTPPTLLKRRVRG